MGSGNVSEFIVHGFFGSYIGCIEFQNISPRFLGYQSGRGRFCMEETETKQEKDKS
jgi:hypothetical protein